MSDVASDVFAYGLAAGLSGTAFLATVMLLSSARGAVNGLALLGGVVVVLVVATLAAALVVDVIAGAGGQLVLISLTKLGLGLFLLSLAWRVRPSADGGAALEAKLAGMDARLRRLQPASAFRAGVGVAILPKRLIITILAGAAIGAGPATTAQSLVLVALYVSTATVLIWLTLVVFVAGGVGARERLDRGRTWVLANVAVLAFAVTLVFGALFSGQAIVELVF